MSYPVGGDDMIAPPVGGAGPVAGPPPPGARRAGVSPLAQHHPDSPPAPVPPSSPGAGGGHLPAGAISASGPGWAPLVRTTVWLQRLMDAHVADDAGWCVACSGGGARIEAGKCMPYTVAATELVRLWTREGKAAVVEGSTAAAG